ncbi:uncharacterized protein L969DRAFT_96628 [Mixia osmundae IAM 14324]|uniref:Uncharacterized protein n=1 Tax=Mixia osmundae (strain CBS 9802 / IAM 14324 / JCM 22182 / KY 12970) TaxID=764103 RepID=G7EB03_MIXOS|nr:uncharacterized protein L969DRAFT_96628 [Mixia osmundae IAM 14324]KEI37048.1 hypothetical protein L969DRAFT_96628 [Mixia osmundae IAM 14324]GAB00014.1 hypothetical protein E5Q_06716 [Mixia osmundae IAM 14324]
MVYRSSSDDCFRPSPLQHRRLHRQTGGDIQEGQHRSPTLSVRGHRGPPWRVTLDPALLGRMQSSTSPGRAYTFDA